MKIELKNLVGRHILQNRTESLNQKQPVSYKIDPLSPDGSDRLYYRITTSENRNFIATDATRCSTRNDLTGLNQNNSFNLIQQHLQKLNFPVPNFLSVDLTNDGLYILQDLGDTTLYNFIKKEGWNKNSIALYQDAISLLLHLQIDAGKHFNPNWAYAGGYYNKKLIIEHELNYFLHAFVINYCHIEIDVDEHAQLAIEFKLLAESAMQAPADFFLYRDFQSKNLMLFQDQIFLIDFQGARLGPCYYDIAALINDPYTEIPTQLRGNLKDYYFSKLKLALGPKAPKAEIFNHYFSIFSLIRTLQTLGAFGYLSKRGKKHFSQYIRPAQENLNLYLDLLTQKNSELNLNCLNSICNKLVKSPQSPYSEA